MPCHWIAALLASEWRAHQVRKGQERRGCCRCTYRYSNTVNRSCMGSAAKPIAWITLSRTAFPTVPKPVVVTSVSMMDTFRGLADSDILPVAHAYSKMTTGIHYLYFFLVTAD